MFAGKIDAPVNRDLYRVLGAEQDGALRVARVLGRDDNGTELLAAASTLPAAYVTEHVTLGYAATTHGVQGRSVDVSHTVIGAGTDAGAAYVGLSRGRDNNTAYLMTTAVAADQPTGAATQAHHRTPEAVLANAITRDDNHPDDMSATTTGRVDTERAASVATHLDRLSLELSEATAGRTSRTLDRLAATGALTPEQRTTLAADGATMQRLELLLRAHELAGRNPDQVLVDAVTERSLDGAREPAQTLYWRVSGRGSGVDLKPHLDTYTGMVPAGLDEATTARLTALAEAADERRTELGARCSADPPVWALNTLGPIPDDVLAAHDWERAAGLAAAARELTGWTDEHAALGPTPAASSAEHRAAWRAAHDALGVTESASEAHELPDGALRARIAAAERVRDWAPAYTNTHQGDSARATTTSHADATLWAAAAEVSTDPAEQATLAQAARDAEHGAEHHTAQADQFEHIHDVHAQYLADNAVTLEYGEEARGILQARGVTLDEPRTSSIDWLAEHDKAMRVEDPHREITDEADLTDDTEQREFARANRPGTDNHAELETGVPTAAQQLQRHHHQDTDDPDPHRELSAAEMAAELERAATVATELASWRDLTAREDVERDERERQWHADEQTSVAAAAQATADEDGMVDERV
jgi:hypothetical protein